MKTLVILAGGGGDSSGQLPWHRQQHIIDGWYCSGSLERIARIMAGSLLGIIPSTLPLGFYCTAWATR